MKARALLLALSTLLGCTHSVHQVAVGGLEELPRDASVRPIEVQADQDVVIATGNTDFVDDAMRQLAASCPRGRVVGIEARHSTSLGFFSYTNRLRVSGYCLEERASTGATANVTVQ